MEHFSKMMGNLSYLWATLIFLFICFRVYWPGKKKDENAEDSANIPLRDGFGEDEDVPSQKTQGDKGNHGNGR